MTMGYGYPQGFTDKRIEHGLQLTIAKNQTPNYILR